MRRFAWWNRKRSTSSCLTLGGVERLAQHLGHARHRVLEHEACPPCAGSAALGVEHLLGDARPGRTPEPGASIQSFSACLPSACRRTASMPERSSGVGVRLDHDGAGAVAEEHRDVAALGGEVEARRVHLAADDEHAPDTGRTRRSSSPSRASTGSRCTGRAGRSRGSRGTPSALLQEERGAREVGLRRERREHDAVDLVRARGPRPSSARRDGVHAARSDRRLARLDVRRSAIPERWRIHSSLVSMQLREVVVGHHALAARTCPSP